MCACVCVCVCVLMTLSCFKEGKGVLLLFCLLGSANIYVVILVLFVIKRREGYDAIFSFFF